MQIVVETDGKTNTSRTGMDDRRKAEGPVRAISLTLLIVAYASMLPYNALWIETMTSGIRTTPTLVYIEIVLGAFGLLLLGGYSSAVAGRQPWNSPRVFWAASTLFNGLIATMGFLSLENLDAAAELLRSAVSYAPEFQSSLFLPRYALTTLGGLSGILIIFWMPIGALLSFLQLLQVLRRSRAQTGQQAVTA